MRPKFNIDGACIVELGRVGIGGDLRNSKGEVLCSFSAFVGSVEAATAELLAIHKACLLCVSKTSLWGRCIYFESNSKEVVSWVNDEEFSNLPLVEVIFDIRTMLVQLSCSLVCFAPRDSNSLVDDLAKRGL
ncbi:hypothetical protein QYF36_000452 [Acer negundo]|nr:hypothetical protein QYF36_000452 [Acer negundo]